MNERLKELIIQALGKEGVVDSLAFGHWALSDEQMEKFTELIVKECAGVELYWLSEQDRKAVAGKIKEHFGVEE